MTDVDFVVILFCLQTLILAAVVWYARTTRERLEKLENLEEPEGQETLDLLVQRWNSHREYHDDFMMLYKWHMTNMASIAELFADELGAKIAWAVKEDGLKTYWFEDVKGKDND